MALELYVCKGLPSRSKVVHQIKMCLNKKITYTQRTSILCSTGILPIIQAVYRKFYLIPQVKTMSDALAYCRASYTDLATIENNDESVRAQNLLKSQSCTSSVWIGLYNDVNSWRWSMGNEPLGSLRMWSFPNPDNKLSREYCAGIIPTGWFDYTCTIPLPFICFDGKE